MSPSTPAMRIGRRAATGQTVGQARAKSRPELLELTEEINDPKYRPQVQSLLGDVGSGSTEIVNLDQPYEGLMWIMSPLDRNEVTAIILWYGLNQSVVRSLPSYKLLGEHFGINSSAASRLLHRARAKIKVHVCADH